MTPEELDQLDDEARSVWRQFVDSGLPGIIKSYGLVNALFAFVESGIAARLEKSAATATTLAEGLNADLTRGLLRFLVIRGVLSATADAEPSYSLTSTGRAFIADMAYSQIGFYRQAYGPIYEQMTPLLRQEKTYLKDVERNGEALGRHCTTGFHYFGTASALRGLAMLGANTVLDLGCGGGGFLIDACRAQPKLRAVGLDISEGAIDYARRSVKEAGLEDRISFVVGDAFRPESWPASCRAAEAITMFGTLHEHFRRGEQAVIDLVNQYASLAENGGTKGLIIGEPELRYNEHDADFFLLHVFTNQGMPRPREGWLPVLEKTKLHCEAVLSVQNVGPQFAYYVMRPR